MTEIANPGVVMANFATYLDGSGATNKWKADSRPAAIVLFDLLLPGANLTSNAFLRSFFRSASTAIKRHSKYSDIWDLGPVLDGIRMSTPVEKLDWKGQKERCAFVLMVFVPLRMIAIWRLDPRSEKPSKTEGAIDVETRDKTDTKRSRSVVTIRPLQDKRLCPLNHYRILARGAKLRGVLDSLFCSDAGRVYTTNDTIRHGVANVIHANGVSKAFGGNSVRHSTINACMSFMEPHQVNAYTGHSNRSETVQNFYYHIDQNWAGHTLSQLSGGGPKVVHVEEHVQAITEQDDAEAEAEESEEQVGVAPSGS
jgi:hypothetical protein